jgi:hypothetical protein
MLKTTNVQHLLPHPQEKKAWTPWAHVTLPSIGSKRILKIVYSYSLPFFLASVNGRGIAPISKLHKIGAELGAANYGCRYISFTSIVDLLIIYYFTWFPYS